ncbi:MAG: endolytic transglycosylase MltG [Clostridia bacterium]|nr:endolytic transglycosylase MltG [Clostridia bacterium]
MTLFGKKDKKKDELNVPEPEEVIGGYRKSEYEEALEELDEEKKDDFFGRDSMTESGSTVMAIVKAICYIVLIVVISGALAYFTISFANDVFAFVKSDEEMEVVIPDNATSAELAEILHDAGVIKYPSVFKIYAKLKGIDKNRAFNFVAGTYTVNGMMNYDELFLAFIEKNTISTFRLTIPEGYTCDEIIELFMSKGIGTKEGWIYAINEYEYEGFDFIKDIKWGDNGRYYRLEGYLFPDTYDFYTDQPEYYYLRRMLVRFNDIMDEKILTRVNELGISLDDALILASLIEEEAYYKYDFDQVSSVLWNRLKSGTKLPKLECDSTIWYALAHKGITREDRPQGLTKSDLEMPDPYNSYVVDGLIPGPICNPGYESISCALAPAETAFYYFVSDSHSVMYYAKTLSEHNANIKSIKDAEARENAQ